MYQPIVTPVNRPVISLEMEHLWTAEDDALVSGLLTEPDVEIPVSGIVKGRKVA